MPRRKLTGDEFRTLMREERARLSDVYAGDGVVAVHVSGGSASAVVWHRLLERLGVNRVRPVFADTASEDADTYRFLDDCERVFGQELTRLRQYNDDGTPCDIWDVFDRHGMMRITKAGNACMASIELKQKPLDAWNDCNKPDATAIGFTFAEAERMVKLSSKKHPHPIIYPLIEQPVMTECQVHDYIRRLGISPPAVYDDGFVHNNCLGAGGCILAGLAQWAAARRLKPEAFAYAKDRERTFADRTGFTVLRDQRGGEVKPYSLEELDREAAAGRDFGSAWRSKCACMTPSMFDDDGERAQ